MTSSGSLFEGVRLCDWIIRGSSMSSAWPNASMTRRREIFTPPLRTETNVLFASGES
ncbi:MAG: hypothetical protein MI923_03595 [Phycisphaerales bacterium]|nr:hypothetical protein [Phycisphaerales bacterium]